MDSLEIQHKVRGNGVKTKKRQVRLIWLNHTEKQMMKSSCLDIRLIRTFKQNISRNHPSERKKMKKMELEGDVGKVSHWTLKP